MESYYHCYYTKVTPVKSSSTQSDTERLMQYFYLHQSAFVFDYMSKEEVQMRENGEG